LNESQTPDRKVDVLAATRPGHPSKPNEDALVVNPRAHVYGVVDGVSAMVPYEDEEGRTGGCIAARLLAAELHAETPDLDLRAAVMKANAALRRRMEEAGIDTAVPWRRWGAVFAVVKLRDTYFEYVQSGDCMIFVRYRDGSVRAVTRNQVAEFDLQTLNRKRELQQAGTMTGEEIARRMQVHHENNRNKANTLGGYSVMNGDPALDGFMESGRVSMANVRAIYAVTDGMIHFIEHDADPGKWETFVAQLDEQDLVPYMESLLERENLDPDCARYPRHKKSDDKSAVVLKFP